METQLIMLFSLSKLRKLIVIYIFLFFLYFKKLILIVSKFSFPLSLFSPGFLLIAVNPHETIFKTTESLNRVSYSWPLRI